MKSLFIDKKIKKPPLRGQQGQIFVMLALSSVMLMALTGFAVDVANNTLKKAQLRRALDAGAIAGMNSLASGSDDVKAKGDAEEIARYNLDKMGIPYDSVQATIPNDHASITVNGTISVNTLFLKLVNIQHSSITSHATARKNVAIISIILDVSGSMKGAPIASLISAADKFVMRFQPKVDQIAIISFNHNATVNRTMGTFNQHSELTTDIIDKFVAGGATNLQEALMKARLEIENAQNVPSNSVKAIVLFTDGAPSAMRGRFTKATIRNQGAKSLQANNPSDSPLKLAVNEPQANDIYDYSLWNAQTSDTYIQQLFLPGGDLGQYLYPNSTVEPGSFVAPCANLYGSGYYPWAKNSGFYYVNAYDCMDHFEYADSRGAIRSSLTSVWPGWSMWIQSKLEIYNSAIYEADYAKNEGITIYVIGLGDPAVEDPTYNCGDGRRGRVLSDCDMTCPDGVTKVTNKNNCPQQQCACSSPVYVGESCPTTKNCGWGVVVGICSSCPQFKYCSSQNAYIPTNNACTPILCPDQLTYKENQWDCPVRTDCDAYVGDPCPAEESPHPVNPL